jgi:hypothetical protein
MALFGDLGKALGLGSGKDILPVVGSALGFYFGGPMGASLGSGIGSLAGGAGVDDALKNAALSYGVTSFISPSFAQNAGFQRAGVDPGFLQKKIYGIESVMPSVTNTAAMENANIAEKGAGFFDDFSLKDAFLLSGIAGTLLDKPVEGTPQRDAQGEAWGGMLEGPITGKEYDLKDPVQVAEYNAELDRYQEEDFEYSVEPVSAAHGGAMYAHEKMGYDTPVTGEVSGPGTGTSDSVPARLSDGEFVLTAQAVRGAGGGDRDIGAARLYDMMAELEATA